MKRTVAFFSALFALATVGLFFNAASAQEATPQLTPEHLSKIVQNCVAAQVTMQRTQASDAVARTMRGREYEDVSRLMTAFNSRVTSNRLSIPGLNESLSSLNRISKNDFFNNYTAYANAMDSALRTDCRNKPAEFYQQVVALRSLRAALKADVDRMAHIIESYEKAITDYRAGLAAPPQPQGDSAQ